MRFTKLSRQFAPVVPNLWIDQVLRLPSLKDVRDLSSRLLSQLDQRLCREKGGVGRDEHPFVQKQGLLEVRRLRIEDIQGGSREFLRF